MQYRPFGKTAIMVSEIGFGAWQIGGAMWKGYAETYRGVVHAVNLLKKIRLEIAVNEDFVEHTIESIIKGARSGKIGDGKIFVLDLPQCIRIRTGESGSPAIG